MRRKKPIGWKLLFLIKIFNFYQKNNFPPIDSSCVLFSSIVKTFCFFSVKKQPNNTPLGCSKRRDNAGD